MSREQRRLPFVVAFVIASMVVSPAPATPPSMDVVFVDPMGLNALIEAHFGAGAARQVQTAIEDVVTEHAPLLNPYGGAFIAAQETASIPRILGKLWPGDADRSRIDAFRTFLEDLNRSPLVRGIVTTPGYSGCAMVLFSAVENDGHFTLEMALSAYQYKGCASTYGADFSTVIGFSLE